MKCKKCNSEIDFNNYYTKHQCKKCRNKYMKEYRGKNREKYNKYTREYRFLNRWLNGGPDNYLLGE